MFERPHIHPGEILHEEFLKPCGVTIGRLAVELELPSGTVHGIVAGREGVCAETAMKLSHYFGTSERFWLEAQMAYDLERARRTTADLRRRVRPLGG